MNVNRGAGVNRSFLSLVAVAALFCIAFSLIPVPASAQSIGTILGVVKDTSGAAVPGATITITNVDTGQSRTVPTGADGAYRAPALPVGNYTVKIEKSGFNTVTQQGIAVEVAQDLVLNFALQVGSVSQQVEVTAEAPQVNTTTSSLGSMVNEQRMSDLPLNGRDYVDLTLIQAGVAPANTSTVGAAGMSGTWFSANGAPIRSNNFTLDGAMLINMLGGSTSSESGTTLGVDGIREYKVVTSAFSAEYGRTMGSQIVMVSKGGANAWHGDAFEYLRNSALDARNFFDSPADTASGKRLPEFERNNFGGSGGGPIRKDKTFFYLVYEGLRQKVGVSVLDTVMPAACHQLVNPGTNNTTLANPTGCASTLDSSTVVPLVIQPFLALYPSPNIGISGYAFPTSAQQRVDYAQLRVDQNFSDADTFFARYTMDDSHMSNPTSSTTTAASGVAFPQWRTIGTSRNQFLTLSEGHIFSPALLNTARASVSRTRFGAFNEFLQNLIGPQYSMVAGQPMGPIAITGFSTLGPSSSYPSNLIQSLYEVSDDLFYTKGRHALKFGVLFNHYDDYQLRTVNLAGAPTFPSVANFMQGIYLSYLALTPGSDYVRYWVYNTLGFYAQDDIRVNSRLTVNAGLRYEFNTTPNEKNGLNSRFVNFYDTSIPGVNPASPGVSLGPVMTNESFKNFSPRLGFAWDVRGNGKTAIRSGFGMLQDVGDLGVVLMQISRGSPPFSSQSAVNTNTGNQVLTLPLPFPPGSAGNSLQGVYYNYGQPYSLQYNLTVDQQIPFGMDVAVSYVGLRGIKLQYFTDKNPYGPTNMVNGAPAWYPYLCGGVAQANNTCTGGAVANPAYRRLNPNYQSVVESSTGSESWYNSLQVVVNKRLGSGLQFQTAYTWSKSLDTTEGPWNSADCQATLGSNGTDPFDLKIDKGLSCFNVGQNFHFNALYHFPNIKSEAFAAKFVHGWWMGNIVTLHTGFPFSPATTVNRSNSGVFSSQSDRLNVVTATTAGTGKATGLTFIPYNKKTVNTGNPNEWYNPLMFDLGPAGQLGGASRNMLTGPGQAEWDFSLNKDTALPFLGEAGTLQFRAEIFNILNHANFAIPSGVMFAGTLTDPAGASEAPITNVGKITSTISNSRQIQFALKVIF